MDVGGVVMWLGWLMWLWVVMCVGGVVVGGYVCGWGGCGWLLVVLVSGLVVVWVVMWVVGWLGDCVGDCIGCGELRAGEQPRLECEVELHCFVLAYFQYTCVDDCRDSAGGMLGR